jgi:hypothetical protein
MDSLSSSHHGPVLRVVAALAGVLLLAAAVLPSAQACMLAGTAGPSSAPAHHCETMKTGPSHDAAHAAHPSQHAGRTAPDAPSPHACGDNGPCCSMHEAPLEAPALRAADVQTERPPALPLAQASAPESDAPAEAPDRPRAEEAAAPHPVRLHLWTAVFLS